MTSPPLDFAAALRREDVQNVYVGQLEIEEIRSVLLRGDPVTAAHLERMFELMADEHEIARLDEELQTATDKLEQAEDDRDRYEEERNDALTVMRDALDTLRTAKDSLDALKAEWTTPRCATCGDTRRPEVTPTHYDDAAESVAEAIRDIDALLNPPPPRRAGK